MNHKLQKKNPLPTGAILILISWKVSNNRDLAGDRKLEPGDSEYEEPCPQAGWWFGLPFENIENMYILLYII